jgi:Holliday junction resolvase
MGKKSINKGKRGEREFANYLKLKGIDAKRGQQHKGTSDSPDVISDLPYHIEVKRVEHLRLYQSLEKAKKESEEEPPIVAHRKNNKDWVIILYADDFFQIHI